MDPRPSLHEASSVASLAAWFAEFRRFATEAEERYAAGNLRPAITSLAAVPIIHRMLVEGCGELTDDTDSDLPPSGLCL